MNVHYATITHMTLTNALQGSSHLAVQHLFSSIRHSQVKCLSETPAADMNETLYQANRCSFK